MRKKLIALFTAVMVLSGYSLPAFAEEITVQTDIITADSEGTEEEESDTPEEIDEADEITEDASDETDETEDIGETAEDIAEQPDTDITEETSDEETSDEVTEESSGESTEDTESAQPEETAETDTPEEPAEEQETAESSEEAAETTDADAEETEELLEEEQDLNASTPTWVKSWDSSTGTLTVQGQLPDTNSSGDYTLAYYAGIEGAAIKKIVITRGTKAGTSANGMFYNMENLTEIDGLDSLDTSSVTNMKNMFYRCYALTSLDLSSFDTSKVTTMEGMFRQLNSISSLDLSSFDTSKVTDMWFMFEGCTSLTTITVSDKWTAAYSSDSDDVFTDCKKLVGCKGTVYNSSKVDSTYARIDKGSSQPGYFTAAAMGNSHVNGNNLVLDGVITKTGANSIDKVLSAAGKSKYDITGIYANAGTVLPSDCTGLLSGFGNVTEIKLSLADTSNVTNMCGMFGLCASLKTLDMSGCDTSNVTDMSYMFYICSSLTSLDLSGFDTSKVTNMDYMFYRSEKLETIIVSDIWSNAAVTSSDAMFYECKAIAGGAGTTYKSSKTDKEYARIDGGASKPGYFTMKFEWCDWDSSTGTLTLKGQLPDTEEYSKKNLAFFIGIDNSQVKTVIISEGTKTGGSAAYMFAEMSELSEIRGLNNLDTSSARSMAYMFYKCSSLKSLDLSGFDTSNVKNPSIMFAYCSSLESLDLSSFDTAEFEATSWMFQNCSALTTITVSGKWDVSSVFDGNFMFENCTKLVGGAGTVYDSDHINKAYAHIDGGASNPGYLTANVTIPAKPTFTVTAGDKSVAVKWNDVSGATSYRVYRKTGTNVTFLKEVTTTSYTDTGLTNGTKYGYLVRAFNTAGGTAYTDADWKFATPTGPATLAKPAFTVTAGDKSVAVKWNAVSGAKSYRVYQKNGTAVKFLKEVTTTSFTDTGLTNGTKYGYLVRAFAGTTGTGYTDADWKYATPVAALAKPAFTVTAGDKSVTVKWNAVSGATSYRIYRKTGTSVAFLKEVTTLTYTDTTVANGTKYGYLVRAFKGSTGTNYTDADWKFATPAAATTLAKPNFTVTAATGSATVKWSAVSGAASYRVYRMDGTTVKFLKEVTTLTYTDTTVANGTKYGYLVRAFKGTTGSAYTNADFKYVTPLAKPTVTLTAGTKQVVVKWNKVTGATSYRVYRIDGSAITALTNTTGTSYTATGLTTGTKYGFVVRAFNGNDASTYASTDVVYTTAK